METLKARSVSKQYLALIKRFPLAPIASASHLANAIAILKELTTPSRLSSLTKEEGDYLDVLTELIAKFEKTHWKPLAKPMEPAEALAYLMNEGGTSQTELAHVIGARQSHISEFLSGKRDLSKESIVRIARFFKVSPELFLPRLEP